MDEQNKQPEQNKPEKKLSRTTLTFYIVGLFSVAIALILISYVAQSRADKQVENLSSQLTQQQTVAQGATQKVEDLQKQYDIQNTAPVSYTHPDVYKRQRLYSMAESYERGRILREGVPCVILGRPNEMCIRDSVQAAGACAWMRSPYPYRTPQLRSARARCSPDLNVNTFYSSGIIGN